MIPEENKEIEANYKRYILERPHIVILGAGATIILPDFQTDTIMAV